VDSLIHIWGYISILIDIKYTILSDQLTPPLAGVNSPAPRVKRGVGII